MYIAEDVFMKHINRT